MIRESGSRWPVCRSALRSGVLALCVAGLAGLSSAVSASEIHNAVRANDIAALDRLLSEGPPGLVLETIANGVTPLHLAAAMNHADVAAVLLAAGAGLNSRDTGGFTPLHWAASRNATAAARVIIAGGGDVNARTPNGITPLHWAAGKNAADMVTLLLTVGANPGARTQQGYSPLHWAVMHDATDAAVVLAFQIVSDRMDQEAKPFDLAGWEERPPSPSAVPEEPTGIPSPESRQPQEPQGPQEPAQPELKPTGELTAEEPTPDSFPRPEYGMSLAVPIGQGQTLSFVWVEALKLWAGKYEVTNAQYKRFRPVHSSMFYEGFSLDDPDQPVVYVSWNQAQEFCDWLNAHFGDRIPLGCEFRLPTEAEWQTFASCGDDRVYPWGSQWPPRYGNLSDLSARRSFAGWGGLEYYDDGFPVTCPVYDSGQNERGIFGLAGNVAEWCRDWYDASMQHKVRRGGSWDFDGKDGLRVEARGFDRPDARYDTIGFRLAVADKK